MNKFAKITGLALMVACTLVFTGYGDEKKAEASPAATQQKQPDYSNLIAASKKPTPENKNPNAPKPTSPLYVYRNNVKDATDIEPFTPEITAAFEKEAKNFRLGEGKKWVYSVNVSKNPNLQKPKNYTQMWIGSLPGHQGAAFEVNGKTKLEQHAGYIIIVVDRATKKIVSINSKRIDNDASTNGISKTTQITNWRAK